MDLPSPSCLQDLCINVVAENLDILWKQDGSVFSKPDGVEWRDSELFLHSWFADKLLEILSSKRKLTDEILSTFTQEHACLKNVKINFCHFKSTDGMQVLSHHKLVSLHIRHPLHMNICTVLMCIGNKSYESLQHLILQLQLGCQLWPHKDELAEQFVFGTLSRFNCLNSVAVNDTDLTNTMLTILCKSLLHVENLNLSGNFEITDISPLKNCQKTLKSLHLWGLHDMAAESAMTTFEILSGLTYLDLSLQFETYFDMSFEHDGVSETHGKEVFTANILLQMPGILPNLECLDLTGRTVASEHALSQFLDAHQSLQMLMLCISNACKFESLQDNRPQLTVGGHATMKQCEAALKHLNQTEPHQGRMCYCLRQFVVVCRLSRDLKTEHFSPCDDDRLVQALCILPIHPGYPVWQSNDFRRRSFCFGLEAIFLLLEKGIIRHLEPDTKQHLLQFCHSAQQLPSWNRGDLPDPHVFAQKILEIV